MIRLIDLNAIGSGDLSALEPTEHKEALERAARAVMNLAATPTPEPATADRVLSEVEAPAMYPVKRR